MCRFHSLRVVCHPTFQFWVDFQTRARFKVKRWTFTQGRFSNTLLKGSACYVCCCGGLVEMVMHWLEISSPWLPALMRTDSTCSPLACSLANFGFKFTVLLVFKIACLTATRRPLRNGGQKRSRVFLLVFKLKRRGSIHSSSLQLGCYGSTQTLCL